MQSNNSDTKGLFKHAFNYLGGNISVQALAIFSIPILTRLLSKSDFGMINVYMSYIGITGIILTLNFHAALSRYYFEIHKEDFKEFVGNSMAVVLITGVVFSSIAILLRHYIVAWLSIPMEVFWGLLIISPMITLQNIFISLKNITLQSKPIMLNTIILSYGRFFLMVFLILFVTKTYLSRIYADIIIFSLSCIYYIKIISEFYERPTFKKEHLKYIFIYSIPLLPHSLSTIILHAFDSFMINSILGSSYNAMYSIAYTIGMLSFINYQSFQSSASPFFNQMMAENRYDDVKNQSKDLNNIMLITSIGVSIFGVYAGIFLTTEKYYSAFDLIPIVVLGYFFMSSFQLYVRIMFFVKKTYFVATTTLTSGIVNIILNSLLIPKFGYKIAAYNTAISFFIAFLVSWFICIKILKNEGSLRMADFLYPFALLTIIVAGSVLTTSVSIAHPIWTILIKSVFMLILIRVFFMKDILALYQIFIKKKG